MIPVATPRTAATTMSTTRHAYVRAPSVVLVAMCLPLVGSSTGRRRLSASRDASLRWHDPDQVRRSKVADLPLSPASPDSRVSRGVYDLSLIHISEPTRRTPI